MTSAIVITRNTASMFIADFFCRGFDDERYVVEPLRAMLGGDTRTIQPETSTAKDRHKPKRIVVLHEAI